jgi:hypothetical protein
MTTPLNLYATKVFAEHPISMWALDESVGYVSLIDPINQDLSYWEISGATIVNAETSVLFEEAPPKKPIEGSYVSGIIESAGNEGLINIVSNFEINEDDINLDLGS